MDANKSVSQPLVDLSNQLVTEKSRDFSDQLEQKMNDRNQSLFNKNISFDKEKEVTHEKDISLRKNNRESLLDKRRNHIKEHTNSCNSYLDKITIPLQSFNEARDLEVSVLL